MNPVMFERHIKDMDLETLKSWDEILRHRQKQASQMLVKVHREIRRRSKCDTE